MTTCPRRMGQFGDWDREEGLDRWTSGDADRRTCSFCKSMHPDEFMMLIRSGGNVGRTQVPYEAPVVDRSGETVGKIDYLHLTDRQQAQFADMMRDESHHLGADGSIAATPFFAKVRVSSPVEAE
jgi:hypothetical protein